jgi:hypothetical protein
MENVITLMLASSNEGNFFTDMLCPLVINISLELFWLVMFISRLNSGCIVGSNVDPIDTVLSFRKSVFWILSKSRCCVLRSS